MFVLSCLCFVTNSCMIEYIKIRLCMMKICLKIAAVLGSYFRIKNGAHTTLTLIPNCIKSILELFPKLLIHYAEICMEQAFTHRKTTK